MNNNDNSRIGIHKVWWVPLVTGIIAIALGVWCFCSPESSLAVFALIFAGCITAAGVLNISYAFINKPQRTNWGWSLVLGLLEIICGVWLFAIPPATLAVAFAYAAGIWLLVVSINSIGEAAYFSRYSAAWTVWMIIVLAATILLVFYFLFNPLLGGVVGWMWIGISLLLFGVWRIALAFKIKNLHLL